MAIDSADIEIGATSRSVTSFADPDEVMAYALAVNDDNARYRDGSATPPTYVVAPTLPTVLHELPSLPESVTAAARAIVHGEHDLAIHKPITPGTWIHTTAERLGAIPTKAGMTIEQVVRTVDDDGDLLVEQHWVTMVVGDAVGVPRGDAPPDHRMPDEARERRVGQITLHTTADQTFRYAGASGDRSPMHVNDEVARSQGFPRKFNQGLCTLGIATHGLTELVADGDPRRVARLAVRFSSPAFPGDDIDVVAYDLGTTDRGAAAFAFEAVSTGRTVLQHGRFEVRPATSA